jgi:hypothetical protein
LDEVATRRGLRLSMEGGGPSYGEGHPIMPVA